MATSSILFYIGAKGRERGHISPGVILHCCARRRLHRFSHLRSCSHSIARFLSFIASKLLLVERVVSKDELLLRRSNRYWNRLLEMQALVRSEFM